MSREPSQEFRRYRQVLGGLFLTLVISGALLLMTSVAYALWIRPGAANLGTTGAASGDAACRSELAGLERKLATGLASLTRDASAEHLGPAGVPALEERWRRLVKELGGALDQHALSCVEMASANADLRADVGAMDVLVRQILAGPVPRIVRLRSELKQSTTPAGAQGSEGR